MRILMTGPIEKSGGVSTHTKMLVKELKKKGIEVELYNTSPKKENKIKLLNDFVKLFQKSFGVSFKIIKEYRKVDLVHIQASGPIGGFIPAIFASLLNIIFKYKLAVTFHYSNTEKFLKEHNKLFRFVLSRLNLLILVSDRQKTVILDYLGKKHANKIAVIPNGYDPVNFRIISKDSARELLNLPKNCRIIVNVAMLLEKKGHKYLIEAMNIIINKTKFDNLRCIIIGKGPLHNQLSKTIENLDLASYVMLTGWITDQNLHLFVNAADLFVLPSLSEGNPTVMFEALGSGLPFVGTRVGGIPEIITSEDYGLLCEPANPEELAEKILIGLDKKWNRDKILEYAQRFTWENIAKDIIIIYEGIL